MTLEGRMLHKEIHTAKPVLYTWADKAGEMKQWGKFV